jgi:hypothetical protein
MKDLKLKSLLVIGSKAGAAFRRYGGVMFFLLFACVYAFIILRINTLSNVQADQSQAVSQAGATAVPRIDANAAKQLKSLQDNSVNVQTLFEQTRTNPFQE